MKSVLRFMKKLQQFRNIILILFISGCTLFILGYTTATAGDSSQKKTVTTKAGLNVRDKADASGKKIGMVPFGETVEITETSPGEVTISGKTGHWVKIKWKKINGWAFDAFLGEGDSPLLDHFEEIAIEVKAPEIECDVYKKAGQDKMYGDGGGGGQEDRVTDKPVWVSRNSVMFEYYKSFYNEDAKEDEVKSTNKTYECAIDGKKILSTKEGETLTTDVKCKLVKTETNDSNSEGE
jgi:hypothetical protein